MASTNHGKIVLSFITPFLETCHPTDAELDLDSVFHEFDVELNTPLRI